MFDKKLPFRLSDFVVCVFYVASVGIGYVLHDVLDYFMAAHSMFAVCFCFFVDTVLFGIC